MSGRSETGFKMILDPKMASLEPKKPLGAHKSRREVGVLKYHDKSLLSLKFQFQVLSKLFSNLNFFPDFQFLFSKFSILSKISKFFQNFNFVFQIPKLFPSFQKHFSKFLNFFQTSNFIFQISIFFFKFPIFPNYQLFSKFPNFQFLISKFQFSFTLTIEVNFLWVCRCSSPMYSFFSFFF